MKTILEAITQVMKWINERTQRRLEGAKRDYANWRAGSELRKENRRRRADLISSTDKLLREKDKSK